MKQKHSIGHLICILCVLVWGTTFIASKTLLHDFLPAELLFFRSTLAVIALTCISPKRLKSTTFRQELMLAGAGLFGVTLYFLLENIALTYTQASNASVIVSIAPILTAFLSFIFLKQEKPSLRFFLGFLSAITGIIAISFSGATQLSLSPKGDILALGAALSWAAYSVLVKKISAWELPIILVTRRIFTYGIFFMIPFMFKTDFSFNIQRFTNPVYLFNILFLGVGASAACFVGWNYSITILGPLRSSVYIYLVPVIAVIASVLILDETVTLFGMIGTILALLGLLISGSKSKSKALDITSKQDTKKL